MKRISMLLGCSFIFILLTGCGSSFDVECTKTDSTAGYKIEYFIGADIEKNNVKSITLKLKYPKKEYAKSMYDMIKINENDWELKDKTLMNTKKITNTMSKKSLIDTYESQGYKCKK